MLKIQGAFPFLGLLLLFSSPDGKGINVNHLNGGASIVYVDFTLRGKVLPLELVRTYYSTTATNEGTGWIGAFGWGWTSEFETTLRVNPERDAVIRDGAAGNTIIFKLKDKSSAILVSSEYGFQTVQKKAGLWYRERDGMTQVFDGDGRLLHQLDKTGFKFNFKYSPTNKHQLTEISSQDKSTTLQFIWRQERVAEIFDSRGKKAKYTYDNLSNLIQVTDSDNHTYTYRYENKKYPHLLTRIEYPVEGKKEFREIRYEDASGMVIYDRDRNGSEAFYSYGKSASDPENNFWTRVQYKLKDSTELPTEQYDEFFLKKRQDGSKYLYKQETKQIFKQAGKENTVSTVTLLTPCCGKPSQITRNGEATNFKYYENGLLKEKISAKEDIRLEYDPNWKKVSRVVQNGFISKYEYDNRGNLVNASNNRNENIKLIYDLSGQITKMTAVSNQKTKKLFFTYSEGRPVLIEQKRLGKIKLFYDKVGRLLKAETVLAKRPGLAKPNESKEVVKVVMSGFENLLTMLRPAAQANSYMNIPWRRYNERRSPTQDR